MTQTQQPGKVHWIDHYVVGSDDLDRWLDFNARVVGSKALETPDGSGRRFIVFADITPCCHHGAQLSPDPLPPSAGLGKGLPRHGLFIRQEDVEYHLRRLDDLKVPHLDPVRTSAEGDEGVSIARDDPDHNQFEF